MKYVQLIRVYHEYSRTLCEGDLHDYISCLQKFLCFKSSKLCLLDSEVYHNSLLTLEVTNSETFREY